MLAVGRNPIQHIPTEINYDDYHVGFSTNQSRKVLETIHCHDEGRNQRINEYECELNIQEEEVNRRGCNAPWT